MGEREIYKRLKSSNTKKLVIALENSGITKNAFLRWENITYISAARAKKLDNSYIRGLVHLFLAVLLNHRKHLK